MQLEHSNDVIRDYNSIYGVLVVLARLIVSQYTVQLLGMLSFDPEHCALAIVCR